MENTEITLLEKYFPKSFEELLLPSKIKMLLIKNMTTRGYRILLHSSPGTGKCLGINTPILMFDGTIKFVQNIIKGDLLMGIDSKPRKVLSTTTGREMLYEVEQNTGDNFICNESHILSTIISGTYKDSKYLPKYINDINILKAINLPKNHKVKLFKVALNFPEKEILIDPYILGYWLGDGLSHGPRISVGEQDINVMLPIFQKYAESIGIWTTLTQSGTCKVVNFSSNEQYSSDKKENPFTYYLRYYNLIVNKHIPKDYLLNSKSNRLKLFAGIVDSDGGGAQSDKIYDFAFKSEILAKDIAWLARSLGYRVNETNKFVKGVKYNRMIVSGDFEDLPIIHKRKYYGKRLQIKNPLVSGFKIKKLDIGDYYGFEIDGDKRFMLGDFTVTHNTTTARLMTAGPSNEVLYLSGSNDFNIETLRGKVMQFATGMSVLQKQKTIVIDEAENLRDNIQDAFKIIFDKCVSVNFIFITNEVEKLNDAVRSRSTHIDYDFAGENLEEQKKNFVSFTLNVCKKENIVYEGPGIKALLDLNFPDFRHLLVNLQQIIDTKETITVESVKKFSESGKQMLELYKLVENPAINGKEFYSEMTKFKGKEKECFLSLGEPFFQYLNDKNMFSKTLESATIVSKYSDSYVISINKFVSLLTCVIELKSLFR